MPTVNPGPAITGNPNAVASFIPVNTQVSSTPTQTNVIRCLALARAVNVLQTGDVAAMPVINASSFIVTAIIIMSSITNVGSAAACTVSVNGGPAVTGKSFVASAALAALTAPGLYVSSALTAAVAAPNSVQTATMGTTGLGSNFIFVNCSVVSAAAATLDIFVYGYDVT
jgi:hypothetical protein